MSSSTLIEAKERENNSALRGTRGTPRLGRRSSSVALAEVVEEEAEREEVRERRGRRLTVSSACVSPVPESRATKRRPSNDLGLPILSNSRGAGDMICFSPKSRSFIPSFRKKSATPSIVLDIDAPLTPRAMTRDRSVSTPVRPNFDVGAFMSMASRPRDKPPVPLDDSVEQSYHSSAKPLSAFHTQWRNPVCQGALPAGRLNHTASVIGDRMFMFGGTDGESLKNQLFVMDLSTFTWSNPETKGTPPSHRYGHSCTAVGTQLFVFGGKGKDCVYNDVHVFDTASNTWFEIETNAIPGRAYHNAWYYNGLLYVAGGQLYNGLTCNTLARFNIVTHLWKEFSVDDFKGRAMAGCVHLGKGKAALVGGIRSSKALFGTEVNSKYCSHVVILDGPKQSKRVMKLAKDLCVAGAACTGYGRSIVVSGGTRKGKVGPVASLIVVDLKTGTWKEEEPSTDSGNPPPSMSGHSGVRSGDSLYFFGGKEKSGSVSACCYWLKVGSSKRSDKNSFQEPKSRLTNSSLVERTDLADVTILKKLAVGGSGSVHLAKWKGETVVLKKYFRFDPEAFDKEVAVLGSVSHSNVVRFLSAGVDDEGEQGVLLEYLPLGDLSSVLRSNGPLEWSVAIPMAKQVAACMKYLHSLNIIHRDLKSSNLLVASLSPEDEVMIKVMDFGDAHELSHHKREAADACIGTTRWTAPEILEQRATCTTKSDVYSFAIVLWEMASGKLPYDEIAKDWKVQKFVIEGGRPTVPEDWPLNYRALVQSCWDPLPEKRPSFEEVEKMLTDIERRLKLREETESKGSSKSSKSSGEKKSAKEGHSSSSSKRKSSSSSHMRKVKNGSRAVSGCKGRSLGSNLSDATLMTLDPSFVRRTPTSPLSERRTPSSPKPERGRHRVSSKKKRSVDEETMWSGQHKNKPSSQGNFLNRSSKSSSTSRVSYSKKRGTEPIDAAQFEKMSPSNPRSGINNSSWGSGKERAATRANSLLEERARLSPTEESRQLDNYSRSHDERTRRTSSPSALRHYDEPERARRRKAKDASARKKDHQQQAPPTSFSSESPLASPIRSSNGAEWSAGSEVLVDDEYRSDLDDDLFLME